MKLKKSVKRKLLIFFILLVAGAGVFCYFKFFRQTNVARKVKIVDKIDKYGYQLRDTKNDAYKEEFKNLKTLLNAKEVNYEEYAKSISKLFIIDFFSLDDKLAKTDVGGVDFVYNEEQVDFLEKAENTYYKYVESNVYGNRQQSLPIVDSVTVNSVESAQYKVNSNGKEDNEAYKVSVTWNYKNDSGNGYQNKATLIVVHEDDVKLSIVELD